MCQHIPCLENTEFDPQSSVLFLDFLGLHVAEDCNGASTVLSQQQKQKDQVLQNFSFQKQSHSLYILPAPAEYSHVTQSAPFSTEDITQWAKR